MSRPPEGHDAAKNNLRLFKLYETLLQGQDPQEYIACAGKLAAWLSHPKAYYSAARPNIVKLLIIAQQTLRTAVRADTNLKTPFNVTHYSGHAMVPSYVGLVKAIEPFQELFVESHLRTAVATLLQSIEGVSPHSPNVPSTSTSQQQVSGLPYNTAGPSSISESPAQPNVNPAASVAPHTVEIASLPTDTTATQQQHLASVPSVLSEQNAGKHPSPDIVYLGSIEGDKSRAVPPTSSPQPAPSQPGPMSVKKKKKRKIDIAAFVQSDLQDFRQKHALAQQQTSDAVQVKSEPETEHVPSAARAEQQTSTNVTSINQPHLVRASLPTPLNPTQLASSDKDHGLADVARSGHPAKPSLEGRSSTAALPSSLPLIRPPIPRQKKQLPGLSTQSHVEPYPKPSPVPHGTSTAYPRPQTINDVEMKPPADQVDDSKERRSNAQNGQVTAPHTPPIPFSSSNVAPIAAIHQPSYSDTPITSVSLDTAHPVPGPDQRQSQLMNALQPLTISEDSKLAQLFKWYEEHKSFKASTALQTKDHHLSEGWRQKQNQQKNSNEGLMEDIAFLDQMTQSVAGKETQLVAVTKGCPHDTSIEFSFDMPESDNVHLLKWVNGSEMPVKELYKSTCLSLGCYPAKELLRVLQGINGEKAADTVIMKAIASLSSVWPQNGGLSMNVNLHGTRKDLPLAPPFATAGDGLVDVSEFITVGKNVIRFYQHKDFTDCMFVLCAHHPTYKQLKQIVERRKKDADWKSWLADVTRPLDITLPSHT